MQGRNVHVSAPHSCKFEHPQCAPEEYRHGRVQLEPGATHKGRRGDGNQPRVRAERTSSLHRRGQVAHLPQLVHGRVDEADGRGVDPAQYRQEPGSGLEDRPQAHEAQHDDDAGGEDADKGDHCSGDGGEICAGRGERAEVDGEVEVGAGKGLDDGETEEEVAGGYPALGYDVFAEKGDDDRAAAKDDGAGEIQVGKKREAAGGVGVDGVKDQDGDESGGEEAEDEGAEFPGHGGEVRGRVGFDVELFCTYWSQGVSAHWHVEWRR